MPASGADGEHGKVMAPEEEPDHRFTLANERTFLAWVRTTEVRLLGWSTVVFCALTLSLLIIPKSL